MNKDLVPALTQAINAPGTSLAPAALVIARIEFPRLDPQPYLDRLDALGTGAALAVQRSIAEGETSTVAQVNALNEYLFEEMHFSGSNDYEDPRNSCLNQVLDRRTGIPITLAVVYMEVARRAGIHIEGVNFPGHFLVRCPDINDAMGADLIIDPFHGGALLSEHKCRVLLQKHVGSKVAFSKSLVAPATRMEIAVRMLLNLKLLYVHMRSFPQAHAITEMLLALNPSALSELRDRGLLAYHLNDVTGALRDLQTYLKLSNVRDMDKDARDEHEQIWEHVKTLRRRVASLN